MFMNKKGALIILFKNERIILLVESDRTCINFTTDFKKAFKGNS